MKKPSIYRHPRQRNIRYLVTRTVSGSQYRVTRKFLTGKFEFSQVVPYMHLPLWMRSGMKMLDFAYDPATLTGEVPGFGKRYTDTYTFYAEDTT